LLFSAQLEEAKQHNEKLAAKYDSVAAEVDGARQDFHQLRVTFTIVERDRDEQKELCGTMIAQLNSA
jgi:hypothetical protein